MSPILALALALSVSLVVGTIVTLVMKEPLRIVLGQLCIEGKGTAFWVTFSTLMFYVTPLLFTLVFLDSVNLPDLVRSLRTALTSSLFGEFAALLVVGYQIANARPKNG